MTLLEAVQLSRGIIEEHAAHLDEHPRPPTRAEKLARWVVEHFGSDPAMAATLEAIASEVGGPETISGAARMLRRRGRVR